MCKNLSCNHTTRKPKSACSDSPALCISNGYEGGSATIAAALEFRNGMLIFGSRTQIVGIISVRMIFQLRPKKIPPFLPFPCLEILKTTQRSGFDLLGLGDLTFQLSSASSPHTYAMRFKSSNVDTSVNSWIHRSWMIMGAQLPPTFIGPVCRQQR